MYEKIKSFILGYSTLGWAEDFLSDFDIEFFMKDAKIEGDKTEIMKMVEKAVEELADPNIGPWTIIALDGNYEFTEDWTYEEACYRADCVDGKVRVLNANGFWVYGSR